ncbi:MAG: methyltransferase domain-containing protein [Planctomycetes bacterium]|nr:methyltransferase domain-containing protein [Planctomycetota bacterium]
MSGQTSSVLGSVPVMPSDPRTVGRWVAEYIRGTDNPDLREYGGALLRQLDVGSADRFLWFIQHVLRLGAMYGARVLDVGCGFGWQALAISMLGGNHVIANDIRESMTLPLQERVEAVRRLGASVLVESLTGDICTIDMPAASFDAIFCNQTLEHVHNLDSMFRVCVHVLKPKGRCVIVNDNNVLNAKGLRAIQKMWKERDRSQAYIDTLKQQRPIENCNIKPYAVMREEIVRNSNPLLSDNDVTIIVDATAGLLAPEIRSVAQSYGVGIELPTPPEFAWCRNPVTGEYCERQFDPFVVKQLMESCGFRTQLFHAFRRCPLNLLNRIALRPLNRWLFNVRSIFVLVGRKET